MRILGITGSKSVLVTFDPYAGTIIEKHAWLNPNEVFVGLAYDSNRNKLYALTQATHNLYSIDPLTRDVKLIGALNLNPNAMDVSGLTYDPSSDTLYTVIVYAVPKSELAKVSMADASVNVVGKIADGLCISLCWRECDGHLNSYIVYGAGAWDSPFKASAVSIDPNTAAFTAIFQTTYHTIMGLARKPGQNSYISAVNWTTHFYGEVNLDAGTVTQLANSDPVGVVTGAMIYRNFYVAPAPNLPPCSFTDDDCLGR
jgi:hypothetical protein